MLILLTVAGSFAKACPPGCGTYYPYYVVVASGNDKAALIAKGRELADKLGSDFPEGRGSTVPLPCKDKENCLALIEIKEDLYLAAKDAPPFVIAYTVMNGYSNADKKASALLAKVQKISKEAYKKRLRSCACE
jgi:hypothetical protein